MQTITTLTSREYSHLLGSYKISHRSYQTAVGGLQVSFYKNQIIQALFTDEMVDVAPFAEIAEFPILLVGTPFQCAVWRATMQIPAGKTVTYHDVARAIGHPNAFRAVANALACNKIAYIVPCHRVIRAGGKLGGYGWGIEKKKELLQREGAL